MFYVAMQAPHCVYGLMQFSVSRLNMKICNVYSFQNCLINLTIFSQLSFLCSLGFFMFSFLFLRYVSRDDSVVNEKLENMPFSILMFGKSMLCNK